MRGPYLAVPRYLGVGTRHLYSRAHACASKIRDIAFRPPSPPPPRRRRTPRFRVTTVHGNEKFPGSRWTPVKYRARPSRRGMKVDRFHGTRGRRRIECRNYRCLTIRRERCVDVFI